MAWNVRKYYSSSFGGRFIVTLGETFVFCFFDLYIYLNKLTIHPRDQGWMLNFETNRNSDISGLKDYYRVSKTKGKKGAISLWAWIIIIIQLVFIYFFFYLPC